MKISEQTWEGAIVKSLFDFENLFHLFQSLNESFPSDFFAQG